jgi:transcriptional regulator with XRE-family HTH domain
MYGQLVKEKRKEMRLTQDEFAKLCRLSTATICNIEKGRNEATFQTRQMIDNVLYPNHTEKRPYGIRLNIKRRENGYTLAELAEKVKSYATMLSAIEHGKARPSISLHQRLKSVLGEI